MQNNKQLSIFCQSLNMSKDQRQQIQQYTNSKNKQTSKISPKQKPTMVLKELYTEKHRTSGLQVL